MEILSFRKERAGEIKEVTVINEPLSKIGAANQGRCRIYILFMNGIQRLPDIGLITMNRKSIQDLSFDKLMETYIKIKDEEDLFSAFIDNALKPNEFLIIDLIFFDDPFRLNFRLRMMAADRSYSDWSPLFQSEIPFCSRLLIEIPKAQIKIYNSENFNLFHYDFLEISRRPAISCEICFDESNINFVIYNCGHGMCTSCDMRHSSQKCCICNGTKDWTVLVRRRDGASCPIDNCAAQTEEYVLYPCGCTIAHRFGPDKKPRCMIGKCCPYKLCQIQIKEIVKIYISNAISNLED